ncbi:hypothetical protein MKS88_005063 [Plasmodium brasilianum]|uniref:Uncharacterized protein n=1 Tax=Plasmodium brasilianum TaxID=5824 RepID=A0ACB9Y4V8_PLABR|nr:hypothetical protein MKS88_005063 [Plasmodium brasilianum]
MLRNVGKEHSNSFNVDKTKERNNIYNRRIDKEIKNLKESKLIDNENVYITLNENNNVDEDNDTHNCDNIKKNKYLYLLETFNEKYFLNKNFFFKNFINHVKILKSNQTTSFYTNQNENWPSIFAELSKYNTYKNSLCPFFNIYELLRFRGIFADFSSFLKEISYFLEIFEVFKNEFMKEQNSFNVSSTNKAVKSYSEREAKEKKEEEQDEFNFFTNIFFEILYKDFTNHLRNVQSEIINKILYSNEFEKEYFYNTFSVFFHKYYSIKESIVYSFFIFDDYPFSKPCVNLDHLPFCLLKKKSQEKLTGDKYNKRNILNLLLSEKKWVPKITIENLFEESQKFVHTLFFYYHLYIYRTSEIINYLNLSNSASLTFQEDKQNTSVNNHPLFYAYIKLLKKITNNENTKGENTHNSSSLSNGGENAEENEQRKATFNHSNKKKKNENGTIIDEEKGTNDQQAVRGEEKGKSEQNLMNGEEKLRNEQIHLSSVDRGSARVNTRLSDGEGGAINLLLIITMLSVTEFLFFSLGVIYNLKLLRKKFEHNNFVINICSSVLILYNPILFCGNTNYVVQFYWYRNLRNCFNFFTSHFDSTEKVFMQYRQSKNLVHTVTTIFSSSNTLINHYRVVTYAPFIITIIFNYFFVVNTVNKLYSSFIVSSIVFLLTWWTHLSCTYLLTFLLVLLLLFINILGSSSLFLNILFSSYIIITDENFNFYIFALTIVYFLFHIYLMSPSSNFIQNINYQAKIGAHLIAHIFNYLLTNIVHLYETSIKSFVSSFVIMLFSSSSSSIITLPNEKDIQEIVQKKEIQKKIIFCLYSHLSHDYLIIPLSYFSAFLFLMLGSLKLCFPRVSIKFAVFILKLFILLSLLTILLIFYTKRKKFRKFDFLSIPHSAYKTTFPLQRSKKF